HAHHPTGHMRGGTKPGLQLPEPSRAEIGLGNEKKDGVRHADPPFAKAKADAASIARAMSNRPFLPPAGTPRPDVGSLAVGGSRGARLWRQLAPSRRWGASGCREHVSPLTAARAASVLARRG